MPPLPTPWNLPFQEAVGSHTSKLIAGSVFAAIRQNAGSPACAAAPGGEKDGPGTSSADTIVVAGSRSLAIAAHDRSAAVMRAAIPAHEIRTAVRTATVKRQRMEALRGKGSSVSSCGDCGAATAS